MLRIFQAEIQSIGPIPNQGLLVSNHLSYLDVLVLGALAPSIFIAKSDVKSWPVFGWLAQLGGTMFADRERRTKVAPLNRALRTSLDQGALVVLFPEGTSSDGTTVLPFKSALLEPVACSSYPLSASLIEYGLEHGDVSKEVCYWSNMTFVPHLLNLLSKQCIRVSVRYSEVREGSADRKELARQLRRQIVQLKEAHNGKRTGVGL